MMKKGMAKRMIFGNSGINSQFGMLKNTKLFTYF